MKAPQDRKTPKTIDRINRNGQPNIQLDGNEDRLTVAEILEGRNGPAIFHCREDIETLRDFCNAWLEADEEANEE